MDGGSELLIVPDIVKGINLNTIVLTYGIHGIIAKYTRVVDPGAQRCAAFMEAAILNVPAIVHHRVLLLRHPPPPLLLAVIDAGTSGPTHRP